MQSVREYIWSCKKLQGEEGR